METTLTPAHALVQPWRTATLVAAGVAIVELALVIALAVTLLGSTSHASAATARPAAKPHPVHHARPAPLPRAKTKILILNGNGRTGAASDEAQVVKSLRYRVAGVGNANRSDYGRSSVLYPPGREREAHRLAADLGIKLVGPLDGMNKAKLRGATVALILGR